MANITGTSDNDVLTGSAGDDVIIGGAGDDIINGAGGADRISGQDGFDVIDGGPGNDTIDGGEGNDQIDGGDGNDFIRGFNGNDTLSGGNGDDSIWGEQGDDTINGDAGNDVLLGFSGDDTINGGEGADRLAGDAGNDTLNGGLGNDFILGGAGDDTLIHTVGEGDDIIDGGEGVDTVVLGLSSQTLTDGMRDDIRTLKAWMDAKLEAAGGDMAVLAAEVEGSSIYLANLGIEVGMVEQMSFLLDGVAISYEQLMNQGPVVDDEAALATAEDTAVTGQVAASDPENEQLTWSIDIPPSHGTLEINAQTGAYVYTPNANFSGADDFSIAVTDPWGAQTFQEVIVDIAAVADAPTLATVNAAVTVSDANEQQTVALDVKAALTDTDGSETLSVRIAGVPSGATLSAGTNLGAGVWQLAEADLANLSITVAAAADVNLTVTAVSQEASGATAETTATLDVRFEIETPAVVIDPPSINTIITGTNGDDRVAGTEGDDTFVMGSGNDFASGGAGDDTFVAGDGNDRYSGGEGFDTLDMSAARSAFVDLQSGRAYGLGDDRIDGIEGVIGSAGRDVIHGSQSDNVIQAGDGNDYVHGRSGDDTIDGGNGNDILYGGRGNDILSDGAGRDFVHGGSGNDTVVAGAGNDIYLGGSGFDTIDFSGAENGMVINASRGIATGLGTDHFSGFEKIIGSDFADVITGKGRGEEIDAGAGDDIIRGARGGDMLTGGEGNDHFVWNSGDVRAWRHGEFDTITDFEEGDTLDFSELKSLPRRFSGDAIDIRQSDDGAMVAVQIGNRMVDVVLLDGVSAEQANAWQDSGYIFA